MNRIRYKKKIIFPAKWQVWLAYIGFEGSTGGKKRPVLVTEVRGDVCSVMEISSQPPVYESDIPIIDSYWAGLSSESIIQTRKMRTIKKDSLSGHLGRLSDADQRRMKGIMGGL